MITCAGEREGQYAFGSSYHTLLAMPENVLNSMIDTISAFRSDQINKIEKLEVNVLYVLGLSMFHVLMLNKYLLPRMS